jgi:hypothetical protein
LNEEGAAVDVKNQAPLLSVEAGKLVVVPDNGSLELTAGPEKVQMRPGGPTAVWRIERRSLVRKVDDGDRFIGSGARPRTSGRCAAPGKISSRTSTPAFRAYSASHRYAGKREVRAPHRAVPSRAAGALLPAALCDITTPSRRAADANTCIDGRPAKESTKPAIAGRRHRPCALTSR